MRTTLTLDDDVAAALERLRRLRGGRFKDVINDVLRRGLRDMSVRPKRHEPFRTKAVILGRVRLASIDNIGEALAVAEGGRRQHPHLFACGVIRAASGRA